MTTRVISNNTSVLLLMMQQKTDQVILNQSTFDNQTTQDDSYSPLFVKAW